MLPRGIRNKNPGNIERSWQFVWKGEVRPGHPKWDDVKLEERFCVFEEPVWGLRAMMKNLITYNQRDNIKTLRDAVNKWAPPNENDSGKYVKDVAKWSDLNPDDEWDFTQRDFLIPLVRAMVIKENGWPQNGDKENGAYEYWYSNKNYEEAYEMAITGRITSHTMNEVPIKKAPEVFTNPRSPSIWDQFLKWLEKK